jgi:hypothetical protein
MALILVFAGVPVLALSALTLFLLTPTDKRP